MNPLPLMKTRPGASGHKKGMAVDWSLGRPCLAPAPVKAMPKKLCDMSAGPLQGRAVRPPALLCLFLLDEGLHLQGSWHFRKSRKALDCNLGSYPEAHVIHHSRNKLLSQGWAKTYGSKLLSVRFCKLCCMLSHIHGGFAFASGSSLCVRIS